MTQEEFNTHRCLLNHLRIQIPYTWGRIIIVLLE
jgi:hypothetical protein